MNNQQQKKSVLIIVGLLVLLIVFFIGRKSGEISTLKSINTGETSISPALFSPYWKVWSILSDRFVSATTTADDTQKRIWGSIQGLATSQGDPYTVFFPPAENKSFKSDIAGAFEGVGMEIGIKDGILTVVTPIKGSPADKAGVKSGDKILKIDGKTTNDMAVDAAVKLIRGDHGTVVKITFYREGWL